MQLTFQTGLGKKISLNKSLVQLILKALGIPHLGTRIRFRILSKLLDQLGQKSEIRILDAGCGYGLISLMISKKGFKVWGVDSDPDRINIARQFSKSNTSLKFIKADFYNLPFKDRLFDLVVCFEVLEHLNDDLAALKELKRVTKNKGKIIISFPEAKANKIGYENFGHIRPGYSVEEFKDICNKLGLKIDQFMPYGKSILGKTVLEIDYKLAHISPVFSSILFPFLYPLIIFDQFFPSKNPWNYTVILSK